MNAMAAASAVLAGLDGMRSGQEEFYRDLHAHPELSHSEHRTSDRVADALRRAEKAGHVHVVSAGVRYRYLKPVRVGRRDGAGVRQAGVLADGQGVHVRP